MRRQIASDTDVLHFVGNGFEGMGFAAAHRARAVGAVFTVWPAIHPGTWGDGPLDGALYRKADAVFCLSDNERRVVMSLGVASDHAVFSPLGPLHQRPGDGERFRRLHGLQGRPIVLFLARRDPHKGLDALIGAVRLTRAAVPGAVLLVGGPPGQAPRGMPNEPWIVDLGLADDDVTADALDAANLVSVPSSAESLGIVVLDAWAHGKPVVVGPSPASRELVAAGQGGFAVEQEPSAIAAALIELLGDEDTAKRMGAAGRQYQRLSYTWPATLDVHVSTWLQAIAVRRDSGQPAR